MMCAFFSREVLLEEYSRQLTHSMGNYAAAVMMCMPARQAHHFLLFLVIFSSSPSPPDYNDTSILSQIMSPLSRGRSSVNRIACIILTEDKITKCVLV